MRGRRIFWLAVLLLYVCFIYGNSLTPASVSSQESGFVRKTAHFLEYAGLGILLAFNFRPRAGAFAGRLRGALEAALVIPFVDETIQLFVEGRSGQVSDVWLDLAGALCGLFGAVLVHRLFAGRNKN